MPEPSLEDDDLRDYFLSPFGDTPVGKTTDSNTDLGELIREIDELAVFNDEAHHIHDPRMAWFKCIQDIVSVLMLKEGWDVRNVSVIVGLRAYTAQSNILPEQTLGRGLRRMYFGSDQREDAGRPLRQPWTADKGVVQQADLG
ncbi:hypothetical protein [Methylibium petroleiphilum]|uniref:hypothetical protein n=1 Tax=Methylibium petroleiphilum TaxID=105560 RepID=UPI00003CD35D|nr:hypothetical protein [Methylibium petroleiphilum]